jgi:GT2 family glycosyltransferase
MIFNKKIAVVILNWNGVHFLEKFLPNVLQHSSIAEVIVADNQSTDNSVNYIKQHFTNVKIIINSSNEGFAKGYNLALEHVKADYYVLLNSDVEVSANWIEPIIDLMEKNPKIAACQPKILDFNHKTRFEYAGAAGGMIDKLGYPFCRGRLFNVLEEDKGQYNNQMEVFWATGACLFVKADAFWKVGGFDEDYFAHMEEIDLCWRMKNIGYQIYVEPASVVYHVGGGTLNKLSPKKTFLNFRNNLITLTKNASSKGLMFKIIYRMVLDGIAAFKFLLDGNPSHFWAVIKAHISFYNFLPSTLQKRKSLHKMNGFKYSTTGVFEKNVVFEHFMHKKNTYKELL